MPDFPNDADGDALRKVAERSDMSRPMRVDFAVSVPDKDSGEALAQLATERGYVTVVEFDETASRWSCYCAKVMLVAYETVLAAQRELDDLGAALGGYSDGWGTPGNHQPDPLP